MRAPTSTQRQRTPVVPGLAFMTIVVIATFASSAPPAPAGQLSPKVKAVLDLLAREPSPPTARATLRQAHLSRAEAQELDNELKGPVYAPLMQRLRQGAEAEKFGVGAPQAVPRAADLRALRETLHREHATRLASLQAKAQAALQQVRMQAPAGVRRASAAIASRMAAFAGARAPANPSPVELTGTDPEPAVTDVVLVIFGHDLGRQGDVTIIVGAEDPRPENAFDCRIMGWGREAIHVTVPVEIEEMHRARPFPNGQRSALVWVRPQGDLSGRWRQITVRLNDRHFTPAIDSVSPAELTPGLRFAIRGQNLAAGASPTVTLRQSLTDRSVRLQTLGYSAGWVEVLVPEDLSGLRAGRGGLVVNNGLASSPSFAVDYVPVEEVAEFTSDILCAQSASIFDYLFGGGNFPCGTLGIYGIKQSITPFKHITHGGRTATGLANDWVVAGLSAAESHRTGHGAGCYFEHAARPGGTEFAATELVAWSNSYCGVDCLATLTIRGPRGVPIGR